MRSNLIKRYLLDETDKTLAFLGLIFTPVLAVWLVLAIGHTIYIVPVVLSFLACAGYLIVRKSLSSSTLPSLDSEEASNRLYWALNILFFLLFAYSILSFQLRPDLYSRPLGYFIGVAFMVSLLAVEILFLPSSKRCVYFVLLKSVLIGLSLEFSQLLTFPSVLGVDSWYHQMFTLEMLSNGHIPEGYVYSQFPIMHLMTGLTSLVTGLDYKTATMLSVSLPQVLCNILLTFLMGSILLNRKVGLLGGLLLGIADWHVKMGIWTIPNTMAAVFLPVIVYLLLKGGKERAHINFSVALLVMWTLILTHTVSAAFMAMFLFVFWAGFKVYNWIYHEGGAPVTLSVPVLFSVLMLSWWNYASHPIGTLAELIKWGFSIDYFLNPISQKIYGQFASTLPFSELLFNNMGFFLFFALSSVGCLFMISRKFGDSSRFVMAVGGVITFAIGIFGMVTGRYIVEGRWWYFSEIMLVLPLALTFFLLCWPIRNRLAKSLFLAALIFSLSFFMILSPEAQFDNLTFSPNSQIRYAFTESELQAIERVSSVWSGIIGVDEYYSNLWWSSFQARNISEQIYSRNYTGCQNMFVLIREEVVNHPMIILGARCKLDYDPRETLIDQGFSRVYDCGSVSGFVYQ